MSKTRNVNDTVILELDRPRELRLGHKALKRFSAMTGCSMEDMEQTVNNYKDMTSLVYVMLSAEDPSLTPEAVDDLLDAVPILEILTKCTQAIAAAFGGLEEAGEEAGSPPTSPGAGREVSSLPPPLGYPFVNGST